LLWRLSNQSECYLILINISHPFSRVDTAPTYKSENIVVADWTVTKKKENKQTNKHKTQKTNKQKFNQHIFLTYGLHQISVKKCYYKNKQTEIKDLLYGYSLLLRSYLLI